MYTKFSYLKFYFFSFFSEGPQKKEYTEEEFIFMLRKTPKNRWAALCDEFGFNLRKITKKIEELEKKEREDIEFVSLS